MVPIKLNLTEEKLIHLLQTKNPKGIEYLYDRYSKALYGTALRIVQNESYADEVIQDAFMNIWNKIDSYDPKRGKLFTWMMNIVRNKSVDKIRSAEVRRENKSDSHLDLVSIVDGTSSYEQVVDSIGLDELLSDLEENQKFVLDKIYYQGYTHRELSKEYSIPLGTVKTRLRNAIMKLREKI